MFAIDPGRLDLVREFRDIVDRPDAPVLIDQEGGRVQRLGPPHWPVYPPGAVFSSLYDRDPALGLKAARLSNRLIAADLADLGITVDCLPLADVPVAGADNVIGDRAYGSTVNSMGRLGLHAFLLGFIHPVSGEKIEYKTGIPTEFARYLPHEPHSNPAKRNS